MLSAVPLWLHLLGAAVWVGSQVMLLAVVVPSLRPAEPGTRQQVLAGVTRRFGYLGLAALVLLVVTGLDNIDRYSPADMFDYRYGYILAAKLVMLAAVVLLTAAHALYLGPKLLEAQSRAAGPDEVRRLRMRSVAASGLTLVLSVLILFCAALLRSAYAYG